MAEEQGIINYDPATTNLVLERMYRNRNSFPFDTEVKPESEKGVTSGAVYKALNDLGGGGTDDYNKLKNKPSINNVPLEGSKSLDDLGIQKKGNYATKDELKNATPSIGENGNWYIGGSDTGKSSKGADGVSLGEIALVQETGTGSGSEKRVISQKVVSEKLSELENISHSNRSLLIGDSESVIITGIGTNAREGNVTKIEDIYYNSSTKKFRKCTRFTSQDNADFIDFDVAKGSFVFNTFDKKSYRYDNDLYEYESLLQAMNVLEEKLGGFLFYGIAHPDTEPVHINNAAYIASEKGIYSNFISGYETVDYTKNIGMQYSLLQDKVISKTDMFYSKVIIPSGAKTVKLRMAYSSGGDTGITFKDSSDITIKSYYNADAGKAGQYLEYVIPNNATSFYISYYKSGDLAANPVPDFDYIYISKESGSTLSIPSNGLYLIVLNSEGWKAESIIGEDINFNGGGIIPDLGIDLYLSEDTGNILQDNITLDELYAEYDNLCIAHPQYFRKLENLGTDSGGKEIREYELRLLNPWVVKGEDQMVEKGGKNIWDNSYDYSKVLINSSTHGDEKTPCWATMLSIKDVLNSNAPWAMFIKSSYIIRICPALNAWGFDNRNRANFNGQDINRDIIAQTQPESSVWKKWIDNNKDAIFYLDVHGVDYFHPFCEPYENDPYNKIYAQTMTKFASVFNANWDKYLGTKNKQATRPYTVISTYSGTTTEYTAQLGIPGFILETPCDIVNNQYNPAPNLFKNYSKSNKIAKDMIINFIIYFGQKFKKHEVPNLGKIELV